jgi:DNA-binding CsgD family transcriptional regulator
VAADDRFVGRQDELDLLRRRLADARAGSGGVVMVSGPAGIGKTRLIEELVAEAAPTPVVWGSAVADQGAPPLWPWTRALRGLPGPRDALSAVVAGDAQRAHGSAQDAAATTFTADTQVIDALAATAATAALVIVLDDLHWADRATLRLLARIATEVRRLPVLVVGAHRSALAGVLDALPRHGATDDLHLGPLAPAEADAYLASAVTRAEPHAVRKAIELSGGNPLYLRTLSRVAAGPLRGDGGWATAVGEAAEFRGLVTAAMRSAGPVAADAVEALSVLGAEADPGLLGGLIGVDAGVAVQRLLPAVPTGLVDVAPVAGAPVRFAHSLVHDAVYASLAPQRRLTLHRSAAELLEPLALGRDERAGAVARHWARADEPSRAAGWAVRAADAARAAGAYDEAASYLEFALEAADRAPADCGVDTTEVLLDLARAQYLGGHITAALASCERAATQGERCGRADVVARAAITVQGIGHPDTNAQVEALCRRALAVGATGTAVLRSRIQAALACALIELGQVDEAARWSAQALVEAAATGDTDAELDAIHARVMVAWRPEQESEVYALGGRAIDLAGPTERPLARLWAHAWRSDCAVHRADMAAARIEVEAMRALAARTGLPLVRWHLLRRQASFAALAGDFDGSRRLGGEAFELAVTWHDTSAHYIHLGQTVGLAMVRGDRTDIAAGWEGHLAEVHSLPAVARALLAAALHLTGRRAESFDLYEPLLPALLAARTSQDAAALTYLAFLATEFGDVAGCVKVRDWMAATLTTAPTVGAGSVFYYGATARVLGQLELGAGRPEAAIPLLEDGIRVDARLGARPFVVHGRLALARALTATGAIRPAAELARQAAADARRLDLPGPLRAADTLIADAAGLARATDPLSDRENEVLALVAQAMSNRDIARALVLSERTVESHMRRILAKTGCANRVELAQWHEQRRS